MKDLNFSAIIITTKNQLETTMA
ncbi:hypothetical protein KT99_13074 [Shewanella benthica KT99]|uniref:Uncharacterized protein n=1 Tax=Shewanella benthica KT99 TaxID=314608 RepID=A9CZH6_9GAMM|nr:hypothetical protein KT99_13074 [Shewanella benthica KT99]